MTDPKGKISEEHSAQAYAFVLEQLKAGENRATIIAKMTQNMGIDNNEATQLVAAVYSQAAKAAEAEKVTFSSLLFALAGGCVGAVVGGILWGLIVIVTDYEIGYMAVGIGFLSGYGVVLFSSGKRGLPLQVIAVASSILGIAIGKYVTFFQVLKDYVADEYGAEATAELSMASIGVLQAFSESMAEILGGYDILWVVLAVVTAWSIPKSQGVKLSR